MSDEYIMLNGFQRFLGYTPDPTKTAKFCNLLAKLGRVVDGNQVAKDIFTDPIKADPIVLSQFLQKAMPTWQSGDQGIGDCVSWACAHNIDVLASVQAFMLSFPELVTWPVCSEAMYGFMRVEIYGRPDYGGDGANGSDAAKAVVQCGTLHRKIYNVGSSVYDFTKYSGSRAKSYGATGVPNDLEPIAREHPVKDVAQITSFDTAVKFISNGYPVLNADGSNPTCSSRDKDGYATGPGYSHAMNYIGVRYLPRPALLKTNSGWSNTVSGPMWPEDMQASIKGVAWWEEASICDRVLRSGDSFAFSNFQGFRQQKLPDYGTMAYL